MKNISRRSFIRRTASAASAPCLAAAGCSVSAAAPDVIYYNGRIVTVDGSFSIAQAVAVRGDRFAAVGKNEDIIPLAGFGTRMVDLEGRTVVPGLIEAHAHPESASLSEKESPLPNPRTVAECLSWIRREADTRPDGAWIVHPKLFATRLRELRTPTLDELDAAAPKNPVFLNASYGGMINTAAMRASGIGRLTDHPGLLRDRSTGRLTGKLIYTAFRLLDRPPGKKYDDDERIEALREMFARYNTIGFTGVTSGGIGIGTLDLYRRMKENGQLTIRVNANIYAGISLADMPIEDVRASVAALGATTGEGDEWVRIAALKTTVDGGILTGTAYLREPWGSKAEEIFGITDPDYRGIPRLTAGEFAKLVRAGVENGWKTTAHCTGGGGVDLMLDAYESVNRDIGLRDLRCSIIHGNFYTPEAAERAHRLNIVADMQPAWFYKDADAMLYILGDERIRTFHPYRTLIDAGVVVSAGSDHMVILDDTESINPYNPWLAMWSMITRKTERGTVIAPEESITREQALRCYTINNAYATFEENDKGSIVPGKLADMAVLDRDFLSCPEEKIRDVRPVTTIVGGVTVFGE